MLELRTHIHTDGTRPPNNGILLGNSVFGHTRYPIDILKWAISVIQICQIFTVELGEMFLANFLTDRFLVRANRYSSFNILAY